MVHVTEERGWYVLGTCRSGDGRDCEHAAGRGGGRGCRWSLFKRYGRLPFTLLRDSACAVSRGQETQYDSYTASSTASVIFPLKNPKNRTAQRARMTVSCGKASGRC